MNRTEPTGGVSRPMPQLRTTMMPNWIGSIPMEVATGSRIGVAIRMIGAMSMIMPRKSRITLIRIAITIGLEEMLVIRFAAMFGTFSVVRQ